MALEEAMRAHARGSAKIAMGKSLTRNFPGFLSIFTGNQESPEMSTLPSSQPQPSPAQVEHKGNPPYIPIQVRRREFRSRMDALDV